MSKGARERARDLIQSLNLVIERPGVDGKQHPAYGRLHPVSVESILNNLACVGLRIVVDDDEPREKGEGEDGG